MPCSKMSRTVATFPSTLAASRLTTTSSPLSSGMVLVNRSRTSSLTSTTRALTTAATADSRRSAAWLVASTASSYGSWPRIQPGAGELGARADTELAEHFLQVVFDRVPAGEQPGGDVAVRQPLRDEPGDLRLLRRELVGFAGALAHVLPGCEPVVVGAQPPRSACSWASSSAMRACCPARATTLGSGSMICGSWLIGAATRTGPWVVQAVAWIMLL